MNPDQLGLRDTAALFLRLLPRLRPSCTSLSASPGPADKGGKRPPASTPGGALPVEGHHLGLVQVPTPCTCIRRFGAARSRGADRPARAALRVRRLTQGGWLEPS